MRLIQFFYNLLFPIVFIFFLPFYLPRMFKRGGYRNQFFQRLGIFDQQSIKRIGHGRLWIHACSVGETFIALKFIKQFQQRNPESKFLLSVTTTTGLAIAQQQSTENIESIASPLDLFFISRYLINLFRPSALIMVEGDVWPERLFTCKKQGIPTVIISARLSPRSEARFLRFRKIIAPLFNAIDLIAIPSLYDERRWGSFGVKRSHLKVTGNIKFDHQAATSIKPPCDLPEVFSALGWEKNNSVLLGGSLHSGEEEVLINAWQLLRKRFPSLRLIIAPRHVERRNEIMALFKKLGVKIALRSEKIAPACYDALLLDTTGELNSWYTIASVVFIGKSLEVSSTRGGQNPMEPLSLGRPVLVGPFMENFEPLISELRNEYGVITVHHAEEIAAATEQLLTSPETASSLVKRGMQILEIHQGATERTCELVEILIAKGL